MRTDRETPDGQGSTARPADVPGRWALSDPEETTSWERVRPREVTDEQWERFEGAVAEMFTAFGMDLDTEGTHNTPRRFVRAMYEATTGYEGDPKLLTAFPTECRGGPDCSISQVIEDRSPSSRSASTTLSRSTAWRTWDTWPTSRSSDLEDDEVGPVYARRFTVQERLGQQIADHLNDVMDPHGVAVHLQAAHLCTQMRGVREERSRTSTSFWRGNYERDPEMRREFLTVAQRE